MDERDLGLIAAEWDANRLPRDRVPEVATELLEAGHDTPSLRVAAGLLPSDLDDAHQLFGRALEELGYACRGNRRGRGAALAREYAQRGLEGRMPLAEAVGAIYRLSLDFEAEEWSLSSESALEFLVLADEWEDEPAKRPTIEADMARELQRFLSCAGCCS
jgi:hypothetical protein